MAEPGASAPSRSGQSRRGQSRAGMWMLVALIAAHTLTTLGYHLMAKYLGVSLDGATHGQSLFAIIFDIRFWGLVVIELGSFGLWLLILARIELGRAILLSAVSYCVIMVVGALVFHEHVGWSGLTGSAMILGGIALLAGTEEGSHDR